MKKILLIGFGSLIFIAILHYNFGMTHYRTVSYQTPKQNEALPSVETIREAYREKIAEYNGIPVDQYNPMPCIGMNWKDEQGNNPRHWVTGFKVDGRIHVVVGHDTTITSWN